MQGQKSNTIMSITKQIFILLIFTSAFIVKGQYNYCDIDCINNTNCNIDISSKYTSKDICHNNKVERYISDDVNSYDNEKDCDDVNRNSYDNINEKDYDSINKNNYDTANRNSYDTNNNNDVSINANYIVTTFLKIITALLTAFYVLLLLVIFTVVPFVFAAVAITTFVIIMFAKMISGKYRVNHKDL